MYTKNKYILQVFESFDKVSRRSTTWPVIIDQRTPILEHSTDDRVRVGTRAREGIRGPREGVLRKQELVGGSG